MLDTRWQEIFLHVFDVAGDDGDVDEAVAEVLALARGDRRAIETARVHCLGQQGERPSDPAAARAVHYLDESLRSGDERERWRPTPPHSLDPWAVAQHRLQS